MRVLVLLSASILTAFCSFWVPLTLERMGYFDGFYTDTVLMIDDITFVTFVLSIVIAICLLLLVFTREQVYKSWLRFSIFSVPIFGFILYLASTGGGGGGGTLSMGGGVSGEFAVVFVAFIYFVISMIVIGRSIARSDVEFRQQRDAEKARYK